MKKKFWGIFMILVFCLGLYPVVAQADDGQTVTDVKNETELNAAIADNAQVRLADNIALTSRLVIPNGQSVTLDLNGKVLSRTSDKDGAVILVNGKLTVQDSAPDTPHHFTVDSDDLWSWDQNETAGKIVSGGIITGGKGGTNSVDAPSGGGVIVDAIASDGSITDASFTMLGGSIVGCSSDLGAGVYVSCGTFTMDGSAQIIGCVCNQKTTERQGAGVYIGGGTFIMNDGARIRDCVIRVYNSYSGTYQGAGVYACENKSKTGRFIMNGGTIENCKIDNDSTGKGEGGGVYLASEGEMTANGGTISGCSAFHGAAVYNAGGVIQADTPNGGTCFNGAAVNYGQISGGVYCDKMANMEDGTISGGTFHGTVYNQVGEVYNPETGNNEPRQGKITDGMFYEKVVNKGIIEGGTFAGSVENLEVSVRINGKTTTVTGEIQGGTITSSGSVSGIGAYTVTFMDGYNSDPYYRQAVTTGQKVAAPATAPQREGYTFEGWYTDADGTSAYDFQTEVTDNLTLYAGWKQNAVPTPTPTPTPGEGESGGNTGEGGNTGGGTTGGGSTGGGSAGSGSTGNASYAVSVGKAANGNTTVNPSNAASGDTVTVTVTPDSGYVLETLTVTDQNGKEIALTDKGDGNYTFVMPAGKVEIKVTFMEDNAVLNYFYDVPNDAAYYEAVRWALENNLIQTIADTDEGRFRADAVCTYTQSLAFLRQAMQKLGDSASATENARISSYYAQELARAIAGGATNRSGGRASAPHVSGYTRAQLVTIVYQAYQGR